MSNQARRDLVEAGDGRLHSNRHSWVRDEQSGSKGPNGGWDTSSCAQVDTVGWERSDQARWKWEMSSCARIDTVGSETSNRA